MPMSRSDVGTSVTSAPSMKISPRSALRKPATRFSNVVLPHPEGPSNVMNSPRMTAIHASSSATMLPKRLVTPSRRTAVSSAAMVDIEDLAETEECIGDDQQQRGDHDEDQAHRRHGRIGVFADVIVHRDRKGLRSLGCDEQRGGEFVERQDRGEQPSADKA